MPTKPRRWQTRIVLAEYDDQGYEDYQTVYVYGETMDTLRVAARAYLLEKKPSVGFSNTGDHITGRVIYTYSGGLFEDNYFDSFRGKVLERGWWRRENKMIRGQIQDESSESLPEKMESFEDAVDDFVTRTFIPEKGPDYHSRALVGSNLRLPLLEKILREAEEHPVNDLIQRGWHIIALEYKGELSMTGELMNRKAIFVMGHPEAQATSFMLNSTYFKKS